MTGYTTRQLNAITKTRDGKRFLPASARMPRNMEVSESLLRKRAYALEDYAVLRQYDLYNAAYKAIRETANNEAEQRGMSKLDNSASARMMVNTITDRARHEVDQLKQNIPAIAFQAAIAAYQFSFYGRLWQMDQATAAHIHINKPPLLDIARKVLDAQFKEAVTDALLKQLLGKSSWDAPFEIDIDALLPSIRRSLETSLQQGEGIPDAMRRLRDTMGISTDQRQGYKSNFNRVQTTTRTYILDSSNSAALAAYRENADIISGFQWLAAHDDRVCPECQTLDGQQWDLGDSSAPQPPAHFNCILPGNEIELPGELIAASKAFYVGRCVEITTSDGARFAVTENHPVLTARGWVKAQFVNQSDYVFSRAVGERVSFAANPDDNHRPAVIEQIFDTFMEAPGMFARTVKVTPEDFYGDGWGFNSEVQIVHPHSFLRDKRDSFGRQYPAEYFLQRANVAEIQLMRQSAFSTLIGRYLPPLSSFMSISNHLLPLFWRRIVPSNIHAIRDIARDNPGFSQAAADYSPSNVEFNGESLFAFPGHVTFDEVVRQRYSLTPNFDTMSAEMTGDSLILDTSLAADFIHVHSALVKPDKVENIRFFEYSGHVFDLQCEPYQLYTCNGVVVKNCRCTVIPVLSDKIPGDGLPPEDAPPRDTMDEWLRLFGLSLLINQFLNPQISAPALDSSQV